MRTIFLGLTLVLLAPFPGLAQQTRLIEIDDYYRVERLGSPALSPDGRHLLYEVETVRREENDRITHVWWTDLESGRSQRLLNQGVNSTHPGWTPDGRRIHLTTTRGGEQGTHFLNFTEPGGEAYRVQGLTGSFTFHPSGDWALVTRLVHPEGSELGGEWEEQAYWPSGTPAMTGPSDPTTRGRTEEVRNRDVYVIAHDVYKRDGTLAFIPPGQWPLNQRAEGSFTQFFRVPAEGLLEGEEPRQITFDEVEKRFEGFSRDGAWILYTVNLTERDATEEDEEEEEARVAGDPEPYPETGIYRIPAGGGDPEKLHQVQGQVRGVTLSPDNRTLAFVFTEAPRTDPYIRVLSTASGEILRELAKEDWVYSIGGLYWSSDGNHLLWVSAIGGEDQLVRVPVSGGPVEPVTYGRHTFNGFAFDGKMRRMAYVKSTAERPWEAFVAEIDGSSEAQVTRINEGWRSGVRLSDTELITFQGVPHNREWLDQLPERGVDYMLANDAPTGDEFEVDAWLMYPADYDPSRTYPMVVSIHGGPHSRYAETWFHEFQMLAAEGMFVLYPNPRGSSGYGMDFQFATVRAWGIDDMKDILHAVDAVLERGIVDPERLGVTGGSYGGFMTSWITAHDHRFRTALTARGIVNWLSFYGVSDASGLIEAEFGGMPWPFGSTEVGSYNLATMLSPIVWADRVRTPTLIIHSINDYRTPLESGEQWFRALRKHEVPVRMVLFPDSSHGLSRTGEPWLLVRRLREYTDWFRSWLVEPQPVVALESDGR